MSTLQRSDTDSRCYSFSYRIGSHEDLPADFPIPKSAADFQGGVFLPRDDPDWFGRSHYPPRILLLQDASVVVLTHPRCGGESRRVSLSDLAFCEVGRILLIGWLRFVARGADIHLPYNTRSERVVSEFLDSVMTTYLADGAEGGPSESIHFGPPLDLKFRNHLTAALRTGECPCACWFSPPHATMRRWGLFRFRAEAAGDLVAVTNRRVLWIQDRWNGRYERYGSVASTAALGSIGSVQCDVAGADSSLTLAFQSGVSWRIPLSPGGCEEAQAFAEAFRRNPWFRQARETAIP